MASGFLRRFRAEARVREPAPVVRAAASRVAGARHLDAHRLERLVVDADVLLDSLRWEAADGFELTDEVRATIAAHAALLTLELGVDCYRNVSSVIVHGSTIEMKGEYEIAPGVMADDTVDLSGEAHDRGPVLIAWDAAADEARHPGEGRNVILHEFAHHLDMLDGWVDGTPPLPTPDARQRWIAVCTDSFDRLAAGDTGDGLIDDYAATDPGEFFAVVTEVFFTRPVPLAGAMPDLYDVFADFYGQDPAGTGPSTPTARHTPDGEHER